MYDLIVVLYVFIQVDYVYMLNVIMCAIIRTICVILENYQVEDGVIVLEVFRKYMLLGERKREKERLRERFKK